MNPCLWIQCPRMSGGGASPLAELANKNKINHVMCGFSSRESFAFALERSLQNHFQNHKRLSYILSIQVDMLNHLTSTSSILEDRYDPCIFGLRFKVAVS